MMWHTEGEKTGNTPSIFNINSVELVSAHSPATSTSFPTVQNVNITKSSRIHVGPNYVSVTQNLHKTQVVRVRFLGLHLRSPRSTIAAFAFCIFMVASALAIFFITFALRENVPQLDIGLRTSWYLRRADWQARDPLGIEFLDLPLSYVIVSHTETHYCNHRYLCIAHMLGLQQDHMLRNYDDILPNYLVSGNGLVFEGRGANIMGAMVRFYNDRSISIAFMGDYMSNKPVLEQFDHTNLLLEALVENGVLRKDFTLYAHCQVQWDTDHPGLNVITNMDKFSHWHNNNMTGCLIK